MGSRQIEVSSAPAIQSVWYRGVPFYLVLAFFCFVCFWVEPTLLANNLKFCSDTTVGRITKLSLTVCIVRSFVKYCFKIRYAEHKKISEGLYALIE
jgi:hypothetical protein